MRIFSLSNWGLAWQKQEEPVSPAPPFFEKGDRVALKERNPFKGSLKCGVVYIVLDVKSTHIGIASSNGVHNSYYSAQWFQKITWDDTGADLYDEALAAQDIMESL